MNFAEKLINWRDNNQELQKCQEEIKDQINAKVTFITEKLKRDTPDGEIGIYVLNTAEFFGILSNAAKYKYKKNVPNSILVQLLTNAFSSKENIIAIVDTFVTDSIETKEFYIFYYTGGSSVNHLIETWFNTYVLPDLERKYKMANRETVRFTNFYEVEYRYSALVKFMDRCLMQYQLPAIQEQIQKLAEDNGLYASMRLCPEFALQIL